jgi:hypothetical protein
MARWVIAQPHEGEAMARRNDWEDTGSETGWLGSSGIGTLRLALFFGSCAVALALILTPIIEDQTDRMAMSSQPLALDMMATGTVGGQQAPGLGRRDTGSYVVRRSVLQPSPSSVCIIRGNGMRTGDC